MDWEVWKEMVVAVSERASEWTPARFGAGARHRGTRVQARRIQGRSKNGGVFGLK